MGRYRVSTLARQHDEGPGFRAGVSIRSGQGSASTDRVMYFTARFDNERAAHHYALEQGVDWVRQAGTTGTVGTAGTADGPTAA